MHTTPPLKSGKRTLTRNHLLRAMHCISPSLVGKTTVHDGEVPARMGDKSTRFQSGSPGWSTVSDFHIPAIVAFVPSPRHHSSCSSNHSARHHGPVIFTEVAMSNNNHLPPSSLGRYFTGFGSIPLHQGNQRPVQT